MWRTRSGQITTNKAIFASENNTRLNKKSLTIDGVRRASIHPDCHIRTA